MVGTVDFDRSTLHCKDTSRKVAISKNRLSVRSALYSTRHVDDLYGASALTTTTTVATDATTSTVAMDMTEARPPGDVDDTDLSNVSSRFAAPSSGLCLEFVVDTEATATSPSWLCRRAWARSSGLTPKASAWCQSA